MMADEKSNPTFVIIGIVVAIVAIFFIGNLVAYQKAQKLYPSKPKKKMGAKKTKRMLLKRGVQPAGE